MKKAKTKKSQDLTFFGYRYDNASRALVYVSLTIVAMILLPLIVLISSQDQNTSTQAAELPAQSAPVSATAPSN